MSGQIRFDGFSFSFSHFFDTFITSRFPRYQGLHETAGGETLKSRLAMNRFSPKHPRPMHNLKNYLHSALPKCTPRLLRLDGDILASIVSVLFFSAQRLPQAYLALQMYHHSECISVKAMFSLLFFSNFSSPHLPCFFRQVPFLFGAQSPLKKMELFIQKMVSKLL